MYLLQPFLYRIVRDVKLTRFQNWDFTLICFFEKILMCVEVVYVCEVSVESTYFL